MALKSGGKGKGSFGDESGNSSSAHIFDLILRDGYEDRLKNLAFIQKTVYPKYIDRIVKALSSLEDFELPERFDILSYLCDLFNTYVGNYFKNKNTSKSNLKILTDFFLGVFNFLAQIETSDSKTKMVDISTTYFDFVYEIFKNDTLDEYQYDHFIFLEEFLKLFEENNIEEKIKNILALIILIWCLKKQSVEIYITKYCLLLLLLLLLLY
jgi:hypothetical protein